MSVPTGRKPAVGRQATSDTPALDERVGSVENALAVMRDERVAKKEQLVQVTLRGAAVYDVPHDLGVVPILCELKEVVSAVGGATPHGSAAPFRKGEWNASLCRMDIVVVSGSLDNCIATFIVKAG